MNIDDMIAVLQATKEGKTIQSRYNSSRPWQDCDPRWAFDNCEYRVKPEPREFLLIAGED